MKTRFPTLLAVLALTLGPAVMAADQDKKPAEKKDPPKDEKCCADCKDCKGKADDCKCEKPKVVMLTGSHIPQRVTRYGRITDGISPVTVISREELQATGEVDLARALHKLVPSIH